MQCTGISSRCAFCISSLGPGIAPFRDVRSKSRSVGSMIGPSSNSLAMRKNSSKFLAGPLTVLPSIMASKRMRGRTDWLLATGRVEARLVIALPCPLRQPPLPAHSRKRRRFGSDIGTNKPVLAGAGKRNRLRGSDFDFDPRCGIELPDLLHRVLDTSLPGAGLTRSRHNPQHHRIQVGLMKLE